MQLETSEASEVHSKVPRPYPPTLNVTGLLPVVGGMEGTEGKPTPPATMVRNFKKVYTGDYGVTMSPGKLKTLCELEWPTFGVGWPAEGSLNRSLVQKVWQVGSH